MNPAELWVKGLMTNALGPVSEWHPTPIAEHADWHDRFWKLVSALLMSEPVEYDDLPDYLTETATDQLLKNDN